MASREQEQGEERPADRRGRLDRFAVVGASFREVGFERLGELVLPPDAREERRALREALGADELVYLATCNRVECWLAARDPRPELLRERLHAFVRRRAPASTVEVTALRAMAGRDAVDHLFRVASGLESLVVGETEIAGQVRRASDECQADGLAGAQLADLFDRAQACSRRVRQVVERGRPPSSVAALAVEKIQQHFGPEGPGVTLLVGVGPMTRKVALALDRAPGERLFANRTRAHAEPLAARFGGRALGLDELAASPPPWLDLVFTATAASEPVLRAAHLAPALAARRAAGAERPLIVCDLGVPRDVDPACDALPGCLVVSLEHMEALARLKHGPTDVAAVEAARLLGAEVDKLEREARWRAIADESARAILASRLQHLSPDDRDQILRFAEGLAARFARQPATEAARAEQG